MSKCIICRIGNQAIETKRHPNSQTIFFLQYLMKQLKKRDKKDIESVCEDCRNPLKLNTILTTAGKTLDNIFHVGKEHIHMDLEDIEK
jgi:hypothetical protein